ncbi:MAG: helix-turn-helix domain-containing protein [Clostridia bacterium]|nr:helix-turn-helix domain-containing protein [Clostridia bacterium]
MNKDYKKTRYILGKGCSISHTSGKSAGKSTLSFSHYTTDCMFYYFIKGNGNIKIEGRNYDIDAGDIIMVNPSEQYMCKISDNTFHERLVLRVNYDVLKNFSEDAKELILPFYERKKGSGNKIYAKTAEELGIKKLLEEIFELSAKNTPSKNVLAICKSIELLSAILKGISANERNSENENPLISKVLVFLNGHFCENISISLIASKFNIDKSYLSHLFKECVGVSVWNYVIYKRLNFFNDLICKNYSIDEAYLAVGFQNYSNFFRLYKKYMKMTPSEFKKRNCG